MGKLACLCMSMSAGGYLHRVHAQNTAHVQRGQTKPRASCALVLPSFWKSTKLAAQGVIRRPVESQNLATNAECPSPALPKT